MEDWMKKKLNYKANRFGTISLVTRCEDGDAIK